jgi:anaerobic selenocysteine-containing dehydrogenase
VPPRESPESNAARAANYPLNIISPKSHGFLNSCYANEPHKIKGQGGQFVMLSPKDAQARSIREGDPVRVFNDRGAFEGFARVTDDVQEGHRGDARLLAEPQPLRRVGELDLLRRLLQPRPGANFLRQSGAGHPRELTPYRLAATRPRRQLRRQPSLPAER